jgi:2-C-methyl-D-erythritol 4-phosphate cytidylyltransferase
VVVFNSKHIKTLERLIKERRIKKIKEVVSGGSTRAQSVSNGLSRINNADFVLIHDGARPFIECETITKTIKTACKFGAAIVGIPVKHTIKRIKEKTLEVDCTLRRDKVWEIQTPQVFKKDLITRAYENINNKQSYMPDDAFLVERLGHRVALVVGSSLNIKITTPEDLILAKAIYNIKNR